LQGYFRYEYAIDGEGDVGEGLEPYRIFLVLSTIGIEKTVGQVSERQCGVDNDLAEFSVIADAPDWLIYEKDDELVPELGFEVMSRPPLSPFVLGFESVVLWVVVAHHGWR